MPAFRARGRSPVASKNSRGASAPPLDPKHRVAIVGLHGEAKLHLEFLCSPHKIENLFRLLRQSFQFPGQPHQRLIERKKLISIFFQELAPRVEREAPIPWRQQREKELRLLPQASQRSRKRGRKHPVMLQRRLDIPRQILHAQVAHRDSKIISCHIFQFMGFIENHKCLCMISVLINTHLLLAAREFSPSRAGASR